ncbi:hypothetical protein QBC34DRAFT_469140 [Podospora aff. communis PSN243]|uniref:GmrSD restriction endonucleases C-terminal domain-containing protein n=1 Tax=Podospora aff. communis PSN243 TaxID=3040156 RepID=A0AAV9GF07_9PEZI|nr:hypothetical protein QBC34DRAFT_469140 [Podospora aff. communis PSN243]
MKPHLLLLATTVAVSATPPGIPSLSQAQSSLSTLRVRPRSSATTYNRTLFPHWKTHSGPCNIREYVLVRDGTNVVTSSTTCAATSGTWFSPYDNKTWTRASDVDIDHMVPLANAWASGADAWTTARREGFANDVEGPQLWVVTDSVNQGKGDRGPEVWRPGVEGFWCVYARSWVGVKAKWGLSVTEGEREALVGMMGGCKGEGGEGGGAVTGTGGGESRAGREVVVGVWVWVWVVVLLGYGL